MKRCFAYIRVSTAKQGEKGVSLEEQRGAISRYADRQGLEIADTFEERETAAVRGRPLFGCMLKRLRRGEAEGVVIHKIDRSARNLRDWADLGELIDRGIEVHFANESLDLHTRGGRLSADIQAVVAADYVRNLREEARKGFYGRLKQGVYPLPAPLGYRDEGPGRPKSIDPVTGPLVRRLFTLYATGNYTLGTLRQEAQRIGLLNRRGGRVTRNGLSTILNNPFYVGLMRLRKTGETFRGAHEPLLSVSCFHRVQEVLRGRAPKQVRRHDFLFRRVLTCAGCGYSIIGERQKGHVYYRCHTKGCSTTGVREEAIEDAVRASLALLEFTTYEKAYLTDAVAQHARAWDKEREELIRSLRLKLDQQAARQDRLTDALIEGLLAKDAYEERRRRLLFTRQALEEELAAAEEETRCARDKLPEFLELALSASFLYKMADAAEKRELLGIVTSNRELDGDGPVFKLSEPFRTIADRPRGTNGTPYRATTRTWDELVQRLVSYLTANPSLDLPDSLLSRAYQTTQP